MIPSDSIEIHLDFGKMPYDDCVAIGHFTML